ncbi:MAG: hypothetical protein AAGN35_20060 [Bacteroidota bacterium]
MSDFNPENIKYLDVNTVNFAAESPIHDGRYLQFEDIRRYSFEIGYQLELNAAEGIVRILLQVGIKGHMKGSSRKPKLGKLTTESFFYLEDYADWIVEEFDEDGEPTAKLHELMNAILLGLAFSTTRGILTIRSLDTLLEGFILPVVAPQKLRQFQIE